MKMEWHLLDELNPNDEEDWDAIDYFVLNRNKTTDKEIMMKLAFLSFKKHQVCQLRHNYDDGSCFRSRADVEEFLKDKPPPPKIKKPRKKLFTIPSSVKEKLKGDIKWGK